MNYDWRIIAGGACALLLALRLLSRLRKITNVLIEIHNILYSVTGGRPPDGVIRDEYFEREKQRAAQT